MNKIPKNIDKILYDVYQKDGAYELYRIADKYNLPYSYCSPCEAETPTIKHVGNVCGVCGTFKNK